MKVNTKSKTIENINLQSKSEYYRFGWKYFGPFLYGFTDWLCNGLKKEKVNRVFFFSRDGYMMKKAFDVMNRNQLIQSQYAYFSRKSIQQALLWKCDTYEESLQYLTWQRFISLGKLLEYYGFSEEERVGLSKEYNLDLNKDYEYSSLKENRGIRNLYEKLKSQIDDKSYIQGIFLKQYIHQIGMDEDCAIVDIGWHGSMQYFIEQFMSINKIKGNICGYYVGIMPQKKIKGKVFGFLYDPSNPKMRKSVLCALGVYEKLFQSTEGSTYGYQLQDEVVQPILTSYEYQNDEKFLFAIHDWQIAALDYIDQRMKQTTDEEDDFALALPLVKVGKNPSRKVISLFSFFYIMDGTKTYFVSQKPWYRYKIKELVHDLSNSPWKTGFMKSVLKIPFPYFTTYRIMRK